MALFIFEKNIILLVIKTEVCYTVTEKGNAVFGKSNRYSKTEVNNEEFLFYGG